MGHGPLLILTPKIVKEQWVKSDLLNGKIARRFQNNNNNNFVVDFKGMNFLLFKKFLTLKFFLALIQQVKKI